MSLQEKKIYIIGQGIAGSVLAFLLYKKGYHVRIIDDGHISSSSAVAAGMWNPVSFKRMSQSWLSDDLLPIAGEIYRDMENILGSSFYHPMELVKIFPDNKSANAWDEHSDSSELSRYLTSKEDEEVKQQFVQPYGHGIVQYSGWLDIKGFLNSIGNYFRSNNLLTISSFGEDEKNQLLSIEPNALIIMATGWKNTELFSDRVKIIPNKGEVLTIESRELHLSRIVNFGKFLIPLGNNQFRLGATYDWNKVDIQPTEKGKETMLNNLKNHFSKPVTVVNYLSGYRPTTRDRRPIIGLHPDNSRLGFFNGFGSKGVTLIPYFALHFIQYLEKELPLMKEVSVLRYFEEK